MKPFWRVCALTVSAIMVAAPVSAHHSFAAYDITKLVTINGTVREFQWSNPHVWIYVSAVSDKGIAQDYAIEGGPVIGLKRAGWSKDSFKPGDHVRITFRPCKDGTPCGGFLQAVTATGKVLGHLEQQLTTPTASAPTPKSGGN
jgi:Family of unknown function (DUF6152)